MQTKEYLEYIVDHIHSTVFATVDSQGRPVTCAIDLMDYDENSLYFLTAKGKNFYDRLKANENIAFTAMKGEDTLSCVAVSVQGKAKEIGPDRLPDLFRKNPYMEKIYPDVRSHSALTVFKIYEGTGEWFDLSKLPIERASFFFRRSTGKRNRLFCDGQMYWLQAVLFQMSAEVYRHFKKACGYSARTLSALRKLL